MLHLLSPCLLPNSHHSLSVLLSSVISHVLPSHSPLYLPPFSSFTFPQLLNHFDHPALLFVFLFFWLLFACILRYKMDGHNKSIYPFISAYIHPLSSPNPSLLYSFRGVSCRRCLPFIIYFHPFVQLLSAVTQVHTHAHTWMYAELNWSYPPAHGFILMKAMASVELTVEFW